MGRGILAVIFIAGFIVYVLFKVIFAGAKAAYDSVFDPNSKNEKIIMLIQDCKLRVSHSMYQEKEIFNGARLLRLMNLVQETIFEKGFGKIDPETLHSIACMGVLEGKHATEMEIKKATEEMIQYINRMNNK